MAGTSQENSANVSVLLYFCYNLTSVSTIISYLLLQKSKEEIDFGVEIEIDSTAPLEKILQNLLDRERYSKAYKLYLLLLVQRRRVLHESKNLHFIIPGHPLKAFKEKWDGDINHGYFEPFQYKSTKPKIISQMRNIGKTDPVTDYMQMKRDWKNDVVSLKKNIGKKIIILTLE